MLCHTTVMRCRKMLRAARYDADLDLFDGIPVSDDAKDFCNKCWRR